MNKTVVPVSSDSSLETINYRMTNSMTLRVPNTMLDSALKQIGRQSEYLDYRIINAEDVGRNLLANQLEQKRLNEYEQRQKNAIDTKGKKLDENLTAEEGLLGHQAEADNALLSNLSIMDKVAYSTVELHIYQRETTHRTFVANMQNIQRHEPGLGNRLADALYAGWLMIENILVALARIWAILLLILIGWLVWKKGRRMLSLSKQV